MTTPSGTVTERLRDLQPETVADLDTLLQTAWRETDPVLLELSRLRLAEMFKDANARESRTPVAVAAGLDEQQVEALADWSNSPLFDERAKAHLAVVEQFNISVADVTDKDIEGLLEHGSDQEVFDFLAALWAIEMDMRLRLVAQATLTNTGGAQ